MRPTNPMRLLGTRILSAFIAWTMAFGPVTAAYAAPTALADVPDRSEGLGQAQHHLHARRLGQHAVQLPAGLRRELGCDDPACSNTHRTRGRGGHGDQRAHSSTLRVGDQVNIIGALQPEYNGFVTITAKPSATQISYDVAGTPVTPGHRRARLRQHPGGPELGLLPHRQQRQDPARRRR